MKWSYVLVILVVLVVLANLIAVSVLPDRITVFNLLVIVLAVVGISYFLWQRNRKN